MRFFRTKNINVFFSRRLALTMAILLGSLAACSSVRHSRSPYAAPNFELKDLSGKTVSLESFKGSVVLIDFWATWCGPCRLSIPAVQEFYSRNKDKGLVVLGLNMDEDPSSVFAFVKNYQMTYPVLFAGNSTVPMDYDVAGIPHFVMVDPQGRVIQVYEGFSSEMVRLWETDFHAALSAKS